MSFVERYLNRHILLELLPAAVFFGVNYGWGLFAAAVAVMITTTAVVLAGVALERRVPVLAVITLVLVLALSGAGLIFKDENFIKIKPTVGKCLFAGALAIGLFFRPSFLVRALGGQLRLSGAGWRLLTFSWIAFTLILAVMNEIVWRTLDTDTWVTYGTAMTPVSLIGYIAITRAVARRHWLVAEEETQAA